MLKQQFIESKHSKTKIIILTILSLEMVERKK